MSLRIGILTSGGDCQSLNATMRGFAKAIYTHDPNATIIGFEKGYYGLMYNLGRTMKAEDFSGLLTRGGTILGTSRQSYKFLDDPDEHGNNKVELMKSTYALNRLDCLVVLGGNGSLKTANRLAENGMKVVGLPKTIDNDVYGTDLTFGFHSALKVATHSIDLIHTTAASHNRVFVVEIMGHKVGWLALYAGIAGGADVILLPEIPYDIQSVCHTIKDRRERDQKFAIIAVAEGAKSVQEVEMKKKDVLKEREKNNYPSVAYKVATEITQEMNAGTEVRVTVPGHMQRGGIPSEYDRYISTLIGIKGAEIVLDGKFGRLVVVRNNQLDTISLEETAGKIKTVPVDSPIIEAARQMGVGFGD